MEGNVVIGGGAAFSWVNIDGGIVHHNLVQGPAPWVMRILNENEGSAIVVTKNGAFHDNEIAFETGGDFNTAVNVGDSTEPETFKFARNHWLNLADPTPDGSRPKLPTKEIDGVYGEELRNAPDRVQVWEFPWGKWLVNATAEERSVEVPDPAASSACSAAEAARFSPLDKRPLSWQLDRGGPPRRERDAAGDVASDPDQSRDLQRLSRLSEAGGVLHVVSSDAWRMRARHSCSTATAGSAARGWTTGAQLTGDKVAYRPYQEAAADFTAIPSDEFKHAVQLVETDGQVYSGAGATFRLLSYAP